MQISNFVNTLPSTPSVAAPPAPGGASPSAVGDSAVPSFITPASLLSTSGGTAAVTLLWTVAKQLFPKFADNIWIPFGCAIFIGAMIYFVSLNDQNNKLSSKERIVGVFIAFLNSMVLFAAAKGIVQ